jgi:parallel beta-helix repeat protein
LNRKQTMSFILLVILIASLVFLKANIGRAEYDNSMPPSISWQKIYGQGPWGTGSKANSLIQTSDGGYALATCYCEEIYVLKLDATGDLEWNRTYGRGSASAIVETDGGYVVACNIEVLDFPYENMSGFIGSGMGGIVVVKLDFEGNLSWNQTLFERSGYSASTVKAVCMAKASDSGYVLGGFTPNDENPYGETDFLIMKTDSTGHLQWTKTYGGPDYEKAAAIIRTADDGFALVGYTSSFGPYNTNYWLVKTDSAGDLQWAKAYGVEALGQKTRSGIDEGLNWGIGDNLATSIIQTSDGGYALFGTQGREGGGYYPWLVKTDGNGNMQWEQTYNGDIDYWQYAYSLAQTGDGGFALAASDRSNPTNGPHQIWLIKTDALGTPQWNQRYPMFDDDNYSHYPSPTDVKPCTIIQTSDNGLAILATVTGATGKTAYFTVIKTTSFLPPPLPPPQDTATPLTQPTHLTFPTITIQTDGTVNPQNVPIERNGDTYTLTQNFAGTLNITKSNITVDGGGYILYGNGSITESDGSTTFIQITTTGVALNSRSHVQLKNLQLYGFIQDVLFTGSCSDNVIEKNIFNGYYDSGISTSEADFSNNRITNNTFVSLNSAIWLNNSRNNIINYNLITPHDRGINLFFSSDNVISHNVIAVPPEYYDAWSGIYLGSTTENNTVTDNIITGFSEAFSGYYGEKNIISHNKIANCGTVFNSVINCTIIENEISDNNLVFRECSGNTIYRNNMVNNSRAASGYTYKNLIYPMGNNTWSKDGQGNYWSNYNGTDANIDGIGDIPYLIDENNQDNYPLMSPIDIPVIAEFGSLSGQFMVILAVVTIILFISTVLVTKKKK